MIELHSGDRRAAYAVTFNVYDPDWPYVSPMRSDFERMLDPASNPFMREGHGSFELFTAHRDGRAVGRIVAAMHDDSNSRHGVRRGQFGFFDCADDGEAAGALLGVAEDWVRARGAEEIVGNFNLTAMQMVGVLTEGFEHAPYTDMIWSPPHIAELLRRHGYEAVFPMGTFEMELDRADPESLIGAREMAIMEDRAFRWTTIGRRAFGRQMEDARLVLNEGFNHNPMFVPLTREEYAFQIGRLRLIIDRRLSILVHHESRPVGALVCIPDVNPFVRANGPRTTLATPWHYVRYRMRRAQAIVLSYSIAPHLHRSGLNTLMLSRLMTAVRGAGYRRLATAWIADIDAVSLHQMERLGAHRLHRLHLFRKSLRGKRRSSRPLTSA